MARIGERPAVWLAHITDERIHGGSVRTTAFQLTPVSYARPATGWEAHQIRCGRCGDPVDWIVQSAAGARRTRLTWMLVTWGVIIGFPAMAIGAAFSPTPAILLLVFPLFYLGGRVLRRSIPRWVAAHGVRIEDGRPDGFGPHTLRVPSGANRRRAES